VVSECEQALETFSHDPNVAKSAKLGEAKALLASKVDSITAAIQHDVTLLLKTIAEADPKKPRTYGQLKGALDKLKRFDGYSKLGAHNREAVPALDSAPRAFLQPLRTVQDERDPACKKALADIQTLKHGDPMAKLDAAWDAVEPWLDAGLPDLDGAQKPLRTA